MAENDFGPDMSVDGIVDRAMSVIEAPVEAPEESEDPSIPQAATEEAPTESSQESEVVEPVIPAIDPPHSWSAEDKAAWTKLPPEAQAIIARRESERDKFLGSKANEVAAQVKAVTELEGQYKQNLEKVLALWQAAVPQEPNWAELAKTDPVGAFQQKAQWDAKMVEYQRMVAEYQQLQANEVARVQAAHQERLQQEMAALSRVIPDFANPEKAPKIQAELRNYMLKAGGTEQELAALADHRILVLAHKAMQYDNMVAAQKTAKAKAVAPSPQKPVLRPGTTSTDKNTLSNSTKSALRSARRSDSINTRTDAILAALGE